MVTWLENSPILFTSLISFFILVVLLGFGWIVRTRLMIRLGLSYVLFSIFVAIGLWLTLNHKYGLLKEVKLHTFIKWYTALVVFFAVWFLIKIFSVFFWDYYLFQYRKTHPPGFLRSVFTFLIKIFSFLSFFRFKRKLHP